MSHKNNLNHSHIGYSADKKHYSRLFMMGALSFISMYALMYAMVNSFADIYFNFNQFYMAGLMTSPMIIIELILMRGMYSDKKLNAAIFSMPWYSFSF